MPTNRTPRSHNQRIPITLPALEAFAKMLRLERQCTCPPYVYGEHHEQCAACKQWSDQHWILFLELQCKPWEYPCVEEPEEDEEPKNQWRRLARERWVALKQGVRELRRQERVARRAKVAPPSLPPEPSPST